MFELSPHGVDVHVGTGPQYPWGGLYGGQIVAQALRAATLSVEPDLEPHSIRAYFIRRGDHTEPVRYEVDRIRNGRSFATRRVVARQAIGAILNAESSFQRPEPAAFVQTVSMPDVPAPDDLEQSSWTTSFDRCTVPPERVTGGSRDGAGRSVSWMRVNDDLGDPADPEAQLMHRCWLAFLSDDLPTDAVIRAHPISAEPILPSPLLPRKTSARATCSARASTTRSGSTNRCAPTDGICTTSPATTTSVGGAWRSATSSVTTAYMSQPWPKRCWFATCAIGPDGARRV